MPRKLMNRGPSATDLAARQREPNKREQEKQLKAEAKLTLEEEREERADRLRRMRDLLLGDWDGEGPTYLPPPTFRQVVTGRTASANPNQSLPPRRGDARIADAFRGARALSPTDRAGRHAALAGEMYRAGLMTSAQAESALERLEESEWTKEVGDDDKTGT